MHEFAHALAGFAMGLHPTVYAGQVVNAVNAATGQQVIQLLAGPLGSLVTSLAILFLVRGARGFAELLLIWFGALSVQEFTPLGVALVLGDVGLGWPVAGAVIFLALSLGRTFILGPGLRL